MWQPGDIGAIYSVAHPWTLKGWAIAPVYDGITTYQKGQGYRDYMATHTMVCVGGGRLFEFTAPRARFVNIRDWRTPKTRWKQFRYVDQNAIDSEKLRALAKEYEGKPYDYLDLLDFGISGLFGVRRKVMRLFGDAESRVRVCSTGAALMTHRSGVPYDMDLNAVPPAYWANHPHWELWDWSRHFDHVHEQEAA